MSGGLEVRIGDRLVDRYVTPCGIRTLEFTAENGFRLNGRRVQLQGVCNHHDLGCLGAAVHRRALERQLYQSQWTDKPVIHLLPHWNWKGFEGKPIPVWCFSNAESVELFVNGKSMGRKDFKDTPSLHLEWQVHYEPGRLRAVGKKNGQTIVAEVRTAGEPARLILRPDRRQIAADGEDLSFVEARIVDSAGNLCPNADNLVTFSLEGPGVIAGVDNGDPTNHEPFQAAKHQAFHGLCLAVIQAARTPGEVRLRAAAPGLSSEPVTITTAR